MIIMWCTVRLMWQWRSNCWLSSGRRGDAQVFLPGVLVLICTVPPVMAGSLNSLQIVQSALSPSCMEYKITGMCYWLFCTLYGCTVKTAVKVRHYIPDAVVSAYNQTGGNPWSEMALPEPGLPVWPKVAGRMSRSVRGIKSICGLKMRM